MTRFLTRADARKMTTMDILGMLIIALIVAVLVRTCTYSNSVQPPTEPQSRSSTDAPITTPPAADDMAAQPAYTVGLDSGGFIHWIKENDVTVVTTSRAASDTPIEREVITSMSWSIPSPGGALATADINGVAKTKSIHGEDLVLPVVGSVSVDLPYQHTNPLKKGAEFYNEHIATSNQSVQDYNDTGWLGLQFKAWAESTLDSNLADAQVAITGVASSDGSYALSADESERIDQMLSAKFEGSPFTVFVSLPESLKVTTGDEVPPPCEISYCE